MDRFEALSFCDGWARKNTVVKPGEGGSAGLESGVYVNLVGWPDLEAHERYQQGEDLVANIPLVVGMQGLRHYELFHVKLHAV